MRCEVPIEAVLCSTKVAVGSSLLEAWLSQVETFDDSFWGKVKGLCHCISKYFVAVDACAVGVDKDADWLE